jgi:ADP-ribose pyrophosphatase YjhB (NUDIX family)
MDGRVVKAHVMHAVDPIISDGDELVMINRVNPPGKGKPALPGGMIDPTKGGGVESAVQAAAREACEEAGVDNLHECKSELIGTRNFDRPFDVRVATSEGLFEKYGIHQGDIFLVSTQAVRFFVPDLANTTLTAGDDALPGTARRVEISSLKKEDCGIPDHFDMIVAAFPEKFQPVIPPAARASAKPMAPPRM